VSVRRQCGCIPGVIVDRSCPDHGEGARERAANIQQLQDGWDLVMQFGAMIAQLPIEEWLQRLEGADSIAPILDPTLYREYLHSGKGELIKGVLRGAATFKRSIVAAQEQVASDPRLQR
jgi:hypothetical protein